VSPELCGHAVHGDIGITQDPAIDESAPDDLVEAERDEHQRQVVQRDVGRLRVDHTLG